MKTVFFDLFETLITEKTRSAFRSRSPNYVKLRTTRDRVAQWWVDFGERVMTGGFSDCLVKFLHMRDEVGSPVSDRELGEIAREYEQWKKRVLSEVDPGVFEMLERVRSLGLGIGIISNAMPNEAVAWKSCPLRGHVDDVVFSCEVWMMKPDRKIYDLACARMNIRPSDAYFVGDGGFDELRGAASAGMKPIQAAWYLRQEVAWPWDHPLPRAESMESLPSMLN
ncbi:MAG: HAD-IA family hydrolase [Gemmatimonadetes bacterium]|nr:HAD-IA family hydrolase [Gemmatimonadota bacterium]